MQEMRLLILLIMLIICSIDDFYSKKVNIIVAMFMGALAFLTGDFRHIDFLSLVPGTAFYLLSKIRVGIGEADGIIFIVLGLNSNRHITVEIVILSFALAFIFSLFLLLKQKINKSETFAFVPFILVSFCIINMKNKYTSGSLTIELSMIMPGIMAMLILIIFTAYYMHDKCVIKRAAYLSCLRVTDEEGQDYNEYEIYEKFEQLIDGNLLGKWQLNKKIEIDTQKIRIIVYGNMLSPAGVLDKYLSKPVFYVNMDAYAYFQETI